jgi:hypothetical protein
MQHIRFLVQLHTLADAMEEDHQGQCWYVVKQELAAALLSDGWKPIEMKES